MIRLGQIHTIIFLLVLVAFPLVFKAQVGRGTYDVYYSMVSPENVSQRKATNTLIVTANVYDSRTKKAKMTNIFYFNEEGEELSKNHCNSNRKKITLQDTLNLITLGNMLPNTKPIKDTAYYYYYNGLLVKSIEPYSYPCLDRKNTVIYYDELKRKIREISILNPETNKSGELVKTYFYTKDSAVIIASRVHSINVVENDSTFEIRKTNKLGQLKSFKLGFITNGKYCTNFYDRFFYDQQGNVSKVVCSTYRADGSFYLADQISTYKNTYKANVLYKIDETINSGACPNFCTKSAYYFDKYKRMIKSVKSEDIVEYSFN